MLSPLSTLIYVHPGLVFCYKKEANLESVIVIQSRKCWKTKMVAKSIGCVFWFVLVLGLVEKNCFSPHS